MDSLTVEETFIKQPVTAVQIQAGF